MEGRINDEAVMMVPFDAYILMRIFARDVWNEIKLMGPESTPCYNYYKHTAERLGLEDEAEDEVDA